MTFVPYHSGDDKKKVKKDEVDGMFNVIDTHGAKQVNPVDTDEALGQPAASAADDVTGQDAKAADSIDFSMLDKPVNAAGVSVPGEPEDLLNAEAGHVDFSVVSKPVAVQPTPTVTPVAQPADEVVNFSAVEKPVEVAAPIEPSVAPAEHVDFSAVAKPVAMHAAPVDGAPAPAKAAESVDFSVVNKQTSAAPVAPAAAAAPVAPAPAQPVAPTVPATPVVPEAPVASAPVQVASTQPAFAKPVTVQPAAAKPAAPVAPAAAQAKPAPVKDAGAAKVAPDETAVLTKVTPAAKPANLQAKAEAAVASTAPAAKTTPEAKPAKTTKKNKKRDDDYTLGSGLSKVRHSTFWTIFFTICSLLWIYPIFLVFMNSFKTKTAIGDAHTFDPPTFGGENSTWVGTDNYVRGVEKTNFLASFGWTVVITVGAVALILLCTSMCAWWIVRVNNKFAKLIYMLFLFNMIVPFQMVMYPLSKIADMTDLNTPWGLWIIYLGFGAGLAVFMFTGTIKGIPQEIEESAMIDGASVPRTFFGIVVPMMKPSIVSVGILETMWVWNDYLLPYLTLDLKKYKTISIAVQYLKGGYGSVDMGAMMGCLVLAMLPIIIFYIICQRYIIAGVTAGAVKG